jgi:hypothetical protein
MKRTRSVRIFVLIFTPFSVEMILSFSKIIHHKYIISNWNIHNSNCKHVIHEIKASKSITTARQYSRYAEDVASADGKQSTICEIIVIDNFIIVVNVRNIRSTKHVQYWWRSKPVHPRATCSYSNKFT